MFINLTLNIHILNHLFLLHSSLFCLSPNVDPSLILILSSLPAVTSIFVIISFSPPVFCSIFIHIRFYFSLFLLHLSILSFLTLHIHPLHSVHYSITSPHHSLTLLFITSHLFLHSPYLFSSLHSSSLRLTLHPSHF